MAGNFIGKVILEQFRVEAFIASGGMGAVYRVWDEKRNVSLAMKVLHAELAEDPSMFKRFEREANALKKLKHPNIVQFYGLYHTLDFSFMLERYVDGPNLKEILRKRAGEPMPILEVLIYMKALCASLGYAHTFNVVHCDVKPGNIMMDPGGNIFLTDFGIARHAESTTTTFATAGTAAYMAPEQVRGEPVSAATDIYALGIMLFELLTGERPFKGTESETEGKGSTMGERIRYAQRCLPPPEPRALNPDISPELSNVIKIALVKEPTGRYQSTQELFKELVKVSGISVDSIPDRVELPKEIAESFLVTEQRFPGTGAEQKVLSDEKESEASSPGLPQKSPLPKSILAIAGGGVIVFVLGLMLLRGGVNRQIIGDVTKGASASVNITAGEDQKDPDVNSVSLQEETIKVVNLVTKTPTPSKTVTKISTTTVPPTETPRASSYSLAFASDRGGTYQIYIMDPYNPDDWKSLPIPDGFEQAWWPTFCRDSIAAEVLDLDKREPQWIYMIGLDGNSTEKWNPPSSASFLGVPRCSPDGQYLAYTRDTGGNHYELRVADNDQGGDAFFLFDNYSEGDGLFISGYASWSQDSNSFISMANTLSDSKYKMLMTKGLSRTSYLQRGKYPALSPDGKKAVYLCGDYSDICLLNIGGTENRLTFIKNKQGVPSGTPIWSGDGKWIYFTSAKDGDLDIYRIGADGNDLENLTSSWNSNEIMPALQW